MFKFLLKAVICYSVGLAVSDLLSPVIKGIDNEV